MSLGNVTLQQFCELRDVVNVMLFRMINVLYFQKSVSSAQYGCCL
jgi:hypothetical protein